MSEDPDKTAAEARGAELRENIALTDARRTEEERAKAEQEARKATEKAEKLEQKEEQQRATAQRLHEQADAAREAAPATPAPPPRIATAGSGPRTEVLVGAAFVGSFLVARILKRIFD
jgi:regulator of protease activity HflC (stomatin/prohibitin superfamily)